VTEDTRQRVERMVKADPTVSAAEIARKAGVSRERIRQILDEMGYELRCSWRKRRRASSPEGRNG
jgi:DNA-directed RNA polymerase sigma subunit (sigma70/sigma32)